MVELSVTAGIVAVFIALALATFNPRPLDLRADQQDLSLQTQVAREFATSRTLHYRLRVTSQTQYVIERGQCSACSGAWTFPNVERTVTLRANVNFTSASVGAIAEFDERGQLVTTPAPTFTLNDTAHGWTKQVLVNTAGMVTAQ